MREQFRFPPTLTADERQELIDAAIEKFRTGQIGPVVFQATLSALKCSHDQIKELRDKHIGECQQNRGLGKNV